MPFERWAALRLVEAADAEWARRYTENPVAYQPHTVYWRDDGWGEDAPGKPPHVPACCEFPPDHAIHTLAGQVGA
jgi:hypothetical protein